MKLLLAKQQRFALMYLYARQMNGSIIKEVRDQPKKHKNKKVNNKREHLYENTQFARNMFVFGFGFAEIQNGGYSRASRRN